MVADAILNQNEENIVLCVPLDAFLHNEFKQSLLQYRLPTSRQRATVKLIHRSRIHETRVLMLFETVKSIRVIVLFKKCTLY